MNPEPSPYAAPRPRLPQTLGYALAGILLLLGLAGLIGRVDGLERLAAPLQSWPKLRMFSSFSLLALGIALFGFLRPRYTVAVWASASVVGVGIASLLSFTTLIRLPDSGMALTSAVMVTAGGLALLLASVRRRPQAEELYLGLAGFLLVAMSLTFLVARLAGVLDPLTDRLVAGASFQVVLASFLLGAYFLYFIWYNGIASAESARWLPAAVGIASIITVATLWRALAIRERDQVLLQTQLAAEAEQRSLKNEVEVAAHSLRRAAEWRVNGASLAQQERDMLALRRDLPGLEGALWVSPDGGLGDSAPLTLDFSGLDSAWPNYLNRVGGLPDSIAYLPLDSRARRFVIISPGCGGGVCTGAIAGVMRSAQVFSTTLSDTTRGFRFSIASAAGPLDGSPRSTPGDSVWVRQLPVEIGEVHLVLSAWPTQSTLGRVRSSLPRLVLVMGLAVSALLPLTLRLGQRARSIGREVERARLTSALERTTDGIWEWDLSTGAAMRSPGIWRYLGYDPGTVPPSRSLWSSLIHPDDRGRVELALQRHFAGSTPDFEAEYRVRSSSGEWHTVVDRGRVVDRSPTGQPVRILGITADVTEARSVQQAREMTELRFRAIFDSGFQFQLLLDRDGAVLEVNRVALEEGGASGETVLGRPVWETLWWANNAEAQARLRQAVAGALSGSPRQYEDEVETLGGAGTILEIAVKPFLDLTGQPTQVLLEARDITARRRAEAALQEVDTLTTMGRVAARVAHEINNPLAGIQNSFLLIKGAVPVTHPHYAYVGAIEREIGRIAAVTRQLYETYRPEPDRTGETSVRTILGDAVAFLEQVNRASLVNVEIEFQQVPSVIPLPSAMLRQIAYNLVQNAIEASPSGTSVQIRATVDDGHLMLRVRDHGPGVPPELRERIFEPFFSTKDKRIRTSGMGLGLALVRRTVTAAGGDITVVDAEGGGSEFLVTLPLNALETGVSA